MRSTIDGCNLKLPMQLDRNTYQRVAKAIEAAGGKWNRKAGCHIFPHSIREVMDIDEDTMAVVDVQQTYQSFYTPYKIAIQMAAAANLKSGDTLMEPSAGIGALVRAALQLGIFKEDIFAIEIDERNRPDLEPICGTLHIGDFLGINPDWSDHSPRFDRAQAHAPAPPRLPIDPPEPPAGDETDLIP